MKKPITINGVSYESHKAAARGEGVSMNTLFSAIKKGRLEKGNIRAKVSRRPVVVNGESYPSLTEAAKACGVSKQAVYLAVKSGKVDAVGMNKKRLQQKDGVEHNLA